MFFNVYCTLHVDITLVEIQLNLAKSNSLQINWNGPFTKLVLLMRVQCRIPDFDHLKQLS